MGSKRKHKSRRKYRTKRGRSPSTSSSRSSSSDDGARTPPWRPMVGKGQRYPTLTMSVLLLLTLPSVSAHGLLEVQSCLRACTLQEGRVGNSA